MSIVVISGEDVELAVPAITWRDHGLPWRDDETFADCPQTLAKIGVERRSSPPTIGVIHWSASENPAPTVWSSLCNRGLSIHFIVDRDGVIHQFVDPGWYRCAHAGRRANDRSVGIEVVNYGHAMGAAHVPDPARPTYQGTVHGWTTTCADFYADQYDAVEALCRAISDRLPIELAVPDYPDERMAEISLAMYSGWLGHYHVERLQKRHPKICPGPRVFEELEGRWG